MAINIRHRFVSAKADGADNTLVRPSNWNDFHTIEMEGQRILGRSAAGTGDVQELTGEQIRVMANAVAATDPYFAALLNTGRLGPAISKSVADWNDATENGWYMATGAANAPNGSNAWFLGEVNVHNNLYMVQEVFGFTGATQWDPMKYRRYCQGGVWTAWYSVNDSAPALDARYYIRNQEIIAPQIAAWGPSSTGHIRLVSTAAANTTGYMQFQYADGGMAGIVGQAAGGVIHIYADGGHRYHFNTRPTIGGDGITIPGETVSVFQDHIGYDQAWYAVQPDRSPNTPYQNTTRRPIMVTVQGDNNSQRLQTSVDGVTWVTVSNFRSFVTVSVIVPPGQYYKIDRSSGSIENWAELR